MGFAPEKVLAARHDWTAENPERPVRLMRAVYQAARWLDDEKNKPLAVEILARSEHLNLSPDVIDPALTGHLTPNADGSPVTVRPLFGVSRSRGLIPMAQSGGMDRRATGRRCNRHRAARSSVGEPICTVRT